MTEEMDLRYYFTTQNKNSHSNSSVSFTNLNGNKTGMMIEVCAGMLDQDNAEQCVIRETEEETGYRLTTVHKIMETYMSPGAVTEILYLFVGEYDESMKVNEGGGVAHEEENIDVMEMSYDEAYAMIASGEIKDARQSSYCSMLKLNSFKIIF
jgi:nudix-type nucleoside diphosphatase (YffH/AdpP family)